MLFIKDTCLCIVSIITRKQRDLDGILPLNFSKFLAIIVKRKIAHYLHNISVKLKSNKYIKTLKLKEIKNNTEVNTFLLNVEYVISI